MISPQAAGTGGGAGRAPVQALPETQGTQADRNKTNNAIHIHGLRLCRPPSSIAENNNDTSKN